MGSTQPKRSINVMQVQKMANVTNTMPLKHAAVAIYGD